MGHQRAVQRSVIFVQGEPMDYVSVITQGVVACWRALDDGRRQITGFLYAGDVLGHLYEAEHGVTAQAVTDVQLCRFSRLTLERLANEEPQLEHQLFRKTLEELSEAHQHQLLLGRTSARERLAAFIVSLVRAMPPPQPTVPILNLPMTRFDIADYLGLTFETVSRTFTALAKESLITLPTPQEVHVVRLESLEQLAEGGEAN